MAKCILCRRVVEKSLCNNCWNYSLDKLVKFPSQYTELEEEMFPSRGVGERVGGSKEPPIPVRLETLHLRTGGISKPLMRHEMKVRITQQHTRITFRGNEYNKIKITCDYLNAHAEWIFNNYDEAGELATTINDLAKRVNSVLGFKSDLLTIGTCPNTLDNDEPCGMRLQINPTTLTSFGDIKCRGCGAVWESSKWRLLGKILDHADH